MKKKILVSILSIVMFFSMMPATTVSAEETKSITPSVEKYTITEAGEYDINGASSSNETSNIPIVITATGDVTLNIKGDISFNSTKAIIETDSACNLTINGNNHTIKNTSEKSDASLFVDNNGANITFKGGIYEAVAKNGGPVVSNKRNGTISIYDDAIFRVTGTQSSGRVFNNYSSTINIYSGIIDNGPVAEFSCIYSGTVNMYGGTITAQKKMRLQLMSQQLLIFLVEQFKIVQPEFI